MRRDPVAGQGIRAVKVVIEADGGSRGNPGPAGYGAVVRTADRATVLAESKQAIGRATNNVAEYRGLIAGLEDAVKLGATEADGLHGFQAGGGADVRAVESQAPRPGGVAREARKLAARFDWIRYTWMPRTVTSTPTGWPTRRWTPRRTEVIAEESESPVPSPRRPGTKRLRRNLRRRPAGPVRAALRPGCCCCAMGRPRCRCSAAIPGGATRN